MSDNKFDSQIMHQIFKKSLVFLRENGDEKEK